MDFLTEYRKTVAAEIDAVIREYYNKIIDIARQIVKHREEITYAVNCSDFSTAMDHTKTVSTLFDRISNTANKAACWNGLGKIIKEFSEPSFDGDVAKRIVAIYNDAQPKKETADDV